MAEGVGELTDEENPGTHPDDSFVYTLTCDTWTLDDDDEEYEFEEGIDTPTTWHIVLVRQ